MADYSKDWFESITPQSREAAKLVWNWVFDLFDIHSIVDVGCGEGAWLMDPLEMGKEVFGLDGEYVLDNLKIPAECFQATDLTERFGLSRKFDLCICMEVAEHLDIPSASRFVEDITSLSDLILFSAAAPMQGGNGHQNERWPYYWMDKFEALGYRPSGYLRFKIWRTSQIAYWYRQNIIMFANQEALSNDSVRAIWDHPLSEFTFPVIHPVLWGERHGVRFDDI